MVENAVIGEEQAACQAANKPQRSNVAANGKIRISLLILESARICRTSRLFGGRGIQRRPPEAGPGIMIAVLILPAFTRITLQLVRRRHPHFSCTPVATTPLPGPCHMDPSPQPVCNPTQFSRQFFLSFW